MRRFTVLAAVVVAALAVVGAAQAGNPDGLGPWADYVVSNHQGCAIIPNDINDLPSRCAGADRPAGRGRPGGEPAGPTRTFRP